MANWEATASNQLQQLGQETNATNQQMEDLRQRINAWANNNPNGHGSFPFTPLLMRNAAVGVTTEGGWIKRAQWGDRV